MEQGKYQAMWGLISVVKVWEEEEAQIEFENECPLSAAI